MSPLASTLVTYRWLALRARSDVAVEVFNVRSQRIACCLIAGCYCQHVTVESPALKVACVAQGSTHVEAV